MANEKKGDLSGFSFDDETTFFGIKSDTEDQTSRAIKEVKGSPTSKVDIDELPDTDEVTNLDDENDNSSKQGNEEDITTFFGQKVDMGNDFDDENDDLDPDEEDDDEPQEDKIKKKAKEAVQKKPQAGNVKGTKKVEEEATTTEEEEVDTTTEEEEEDTKEDNKDQDDTEFYTQLGKELKENGVFKHVEIKDGDKITLEKFFELQEEEIEKGIEETIEALAENMDDDGRDFLKFKMNGGKTTEWLATYNTGLNISEYDENNPVHVKQVLTHYLTTVEKLEPEDLEDRMKYLKDGGKEKTYATKYFKLIEQEREEQRKELLKQAEDASKKKEEDTKRFNQSLSKVLTSTEEAHGIKFTKNDQKVLNDYVTRPTVKVGKNRYVPEFQSDLANTLRAETDEDKKKLLIIAKILKNKFDFSDLVTTAKTTAVKKIKSKLKDAKLNKVPASSGGGKGKKSLADMFGGE